MAALRAALATTAATASSATVHAPNVRLRAGTSTNWAGLNAVAGAPGSFQNVSASWTQPAVTCTVADSYSAYWVGLDGDTTSTVEQLGTEADCVGGRRSLLVVVRDVPAPQLPRLTRRGRAR